MTIQALRSTFPEYAKDAKLNLSTVLEKVEDLNLEATQVAGIALACAYVTSNKQLITAIKAQFAEQFDDTIINAAKAAAVTMAMNNVYYRFTHLIVDKEFAKLPARLRMNIIANPGVSKIDFELYCLAISAINGCGSCINSHAHSLQKLGLDNTAIQASIRIASVIQAAVQVLRIEQIEE